MKINAWENCFAGAWAIIVLILFPNYLCLSFYYHVMKTSTNMVIKSVDVVGSCSFHVWTNRGIFYRLFFDVILFCGFYLIYILLQQSSIHQWNPHSYNKLPYSMHIRCGIYCAPWNYDDFNIASLWIISLVCWNNFSPRIMSVRLALFSTRCKIKSVETNLCLVKYSLT